MIVIIQKYFIVFIVLSVNAKLKAEKIRRIPLTVYYGSNGPESQLFVLTQLKPAVQMLHQYLKIRLIPFGKSRSIDFGYAGFECEHGPTECMGNLIQDCTLNYMGHRSDLKKVEYVACEMEHSSATQGNLDCAVKSKVEKGLVQECVLKDRGIILQLDSEYQTSLVNANFIPTVTVNGEFNQTIQDYAQVDLIGVLCSMLKQTRPCAKYYNILALNHVLHSPIHKYHYNNYNFIPGTNTRNKIEYS